MCSINLTRSSGDHRRFAAHWGERRMKSICLPLRRFAKAATPDAQVPGLAPASQPRADRRPMATWQCLILGRQIEQIVDRSRHGVCGAVLLHKVLLRHLHAWARAVPPCFNDRPEKQHQQFNGQADDCQQQQPVNPVKWDSLSIHRVARFPFFVGPGRQRMAATPL